MDTSTNGVLPRPPKAPKVSLETIERIAKLLAQCCTIAAAIAAFIVASVRYGGQGFYYVSVAYKAVNDAYHGKEVEPEEAVADVTIAYLYVVQKGDQINDLALHHHMSANQILDLNPHITNPDKIEAKQTKLRLRAQCYHVVKPGDILKVVADKYNITVKELMRANHKKRNFAQRGERLVIPYHVRP